MENQNPQQDTINTDPSSITRTDSDGMQTPLLDKHENHKKVTLFVILFVIVAIVLFFILNKNLFKKTDEARTVTNEERIKTLERLDVMTDEMRANEATDEQKVNFLDRLDTEIPDSKGPKISQEELEKILSDTN